MAASRNKCPCIYNAPLARPSAQEQKKIRKTKRSVLKQEDNVDQTSQLKPKYIYGTKGKGAEFNVNRRTCFVSFEGSTLEY